MTTYVLRKNAKGKYRLVEKARADLGPMVYVQGDLKPYVSPICDARGVHPVIDGRSAQREDLRRNGCRIKEPSETLARAGVPKRPEPVVTESMLRTMSETYDRMQSER